MSAIFVIIYSTKIYMSDKSDLHQGLGTRGLGDIGPVASQLADQGGTMASKVLSTASAVMSAAEPMATQFLQDLKNKMPEITVGTSKACVGTEGGDAQCIGLYGSNHAHADDGKTGVIQDWAGKIASWTGLEGIRDIVDRLVSLTELWWLTPAQVANAGLVASVLSFVAYLVGVLDTSDWLHIKVNILAIILSTTSVALFGLFWYGSQKLASCLTHAGGHVGQLQQGPSFKSAKISLYASVSQLASAGVQLMMPCAERLYKAYGKQRRSWQRRHGRVIGKPRQ
ncbi:hypothetical protein MY3296_009598 [Beauveria thailandica]